MKVSVYKDLTGKKMVVKQSSLNLTKDEAEGASWRSKNCTWKPVLFGSCSLFHRLNLMLLFE